MLSATLKIEHEAGLHARPAALFVQIASKFSSRIWVETDTKKVNAKSIMGVMSLGVQSGQEITLIVEGKDEKEAMAALSRLIKSNFADIPEIKKSFES